MEELLTIAVLIWFITTFWHFLLITTLIIFVTHIILAVWDIIRGTTPEKEQRKEKYYNRPKPPINGSQIPFI